jgi:hypothetical protein
VTTSGAGAAAARAEVRELIAQKGHAVDNAGAATARLEAACAAGDLVQSAFLDQALGDLATALDQEDGQRLGGKSAEASRFILRAVDRALDDA